MYLVVGLGNPGKKYEMTRHNIGFMVLDYFADKKGESFSDSKWEAKVSKIQIGQQQVILAKPETYMNNSGRAVGKICSYYKIPAENVIVVQDDLDLELGRLKLVVNRGAGGHNGILSIIQHLGGKSFSRIRVGIGRPAPDSGISVSGFVLAKFKPSEKVSIDELLVSVVDGICLICAQGPLDAMNTINRQ